MNYQRIYDNLILKAKNSTLDDNYEIHHIIPRCMGGNDESENLIKLTYRQHYVAHWLLWRIHRTNELFYAFYMMNQTSKYTTRDYMNSHMFQVVKEEYKRIGSWNKGKRGYLKGTSVYKYEDGTTVRLPITHEDVLSGKAVGVSKGRKSPTLGMKFSEETKKKMSIQRSGENSYMFGKTMSDETKRKISESRKRLTDEDLKQRDQQRVSNLKYKQFECPHCGKIGGPIMKRWHFDNCKDKNEKT